MEAEADISEKNFVWWSGAENFEFEFRFSNSKFSLECFS